MILLAVPTLKLVLPADSAEGLSHAVGYLRLVAVFYLFNFLGSGQSGYFHGRGRVNLPVMGTTSHITIRAILSALLVMHGQQLPTSSNQYKRNAFPLRY